jgi:nucleotide-binding universal stress UspA family protein
MSRQIGSPKDPDTKATLRALRRAARRARALGARTGTPVYVIQDHRIVDLTKQDKILAKEMLKQREAR